MIRDWVEDAIGVATHWGAITLPPKTIFSWILLLIIGLLHAHHLVLLLFVRKAVAWSVFPLTLVEFVVVLVCQFLLGNHWRALKSDLSRIMGSFLMLLMRLLVDSIWLVSGLDDMVTGVVHLLAHHGGCCGVYSRTRVVVKATWGVKARLGLLIWLLRVGLVVFPTAQCIISRLKLTLIDLVYRHYCIVIRAMIWVIKGGLLLRHLMLLLVAEITAMVKVFRLLTHVLVCLMLVSSKIGLKVGRWRITIGVAWLEILLTTTVLLVIIGHFLMTSA